MELEALIAEIKETVAGLGSKEDNEQIKLTLESTLERMKELEVRFDELKAMRNLGVDPSQGGLFMTGEKKEAHEFLTWFKSAISRNQSAEQKKALSEATDAAGGYLVPDDFRPRILRLVEQYGIIRSLATVIPMVRDKISFPTLVSGVSCYWGSAMGGQSWSVATGGITESQPSFGEVQLAIDDLYCLVPIANQLIDDSSIDIANLIITLMAEAVAQEEDRIGLLGDKDNSDPFDGVGFSGISFVTVSGTSYSAIDADDLLSLQDKISGDDSNAIYVLHKTILNVFRGLKDTSGNYIVQPATASEPATIWGRPYVKSNIMPTINDATHNKPAVLYGDFRQLYMGDRKAFAIATSAENQFEYNRTLIRMHERVCFDVPLPAAFAGIRTAAGTTTTS